MMAFTRTVQLMHFIKCLVCVGHFVCSMREKRPGTTLDQAGIDPGYLTTLPGTILPKNQTACASRICWQCLHTASTKQIWQRIHDVVLHGSQTFSTSIVLQKIQIRGCLQARPGRVSGSSNASATPGQATYSPRPQTHRRLR